jgi:hypothetical protein
LLQCRNDRCGLGLDLFLRENVAIGIDDADVCGFERYVETGEVVHDPLP